MKTLLDDFQRLKLVSTGDIIDWKQSNHLLEANNELWAQFNSPPDFFDLVTGVTKKEYSIISMTL